MWDLIGFQVLGIFVPCYESPSTMQIPARAPQFWVSGPPAHPIAPSSRSLPSLWLVNSTLLKAADITAVWPQECLEEKPWVGDRQSRGALACPVHCPAACLLVWGVLRSPCGKTNIRFFIRAQGRFVPRFPVAWASLSTRKPAETWNEDSVGGAVTRRWSSSIRWEVVWLDLEAWSRPPLVWGLPMPRISRKDVGVMAAASPDII